jgi:xylose dehydrogenase (NAD/NADP)
MANRIRWGVLGASDIARKAVIPAIRASSNGSLAAIASRDPARARAAAEELGFDHVADSYEALLARPDIDAVYIPLPNSLHVDWIVKAAQAGKAVLCEKPIALSAAQAKPAIELCARLGVPLMEAFMYHFHPQTAQVKVLLASGAIGEVREVRAHLSVNFMNPVDPRNVRFDAALGGGTLLDMGCYTTGLARMVFGAEPRRISATWLLDERFGVDVQTSAILEFDSGVALASCAFRAGGQGAYSIVGTRGTIEAPRGFIPGLGSREAEAILVIADENGTRREERFAPVDQYNLMVEAFADAVIHKRPVPLPPSESLANMAVLDAIAEAARRGAAVTLC